MTRSEALERIAEILDALRPIRTAVATLEQAKLQTRLTTLSHRLNTDPVNRAEHYADLAAEQILLDLIPAQAQLRSYERELDALEAMLAYLPE